MSQAVLFKLSVFIVYPWLYLILKHIQGVPKQAEKLKSRKMKEGWMKNDECWRLNDEGWWFQAVEGFCDWLTDRQTDGWTFVNVESLLQLKKCELLLLLLVVIHTFQSWKWLYNHKCLSVCSSVSQQNPSTTWNHHPSLFILHHSSFIHHRYHHSSFILPSFCDF